MSSSPKVSGPSRTMLVAIFIAISLVLLAAGYGYYRSETEKVRGHKYEEIAAIGDLKSRQIHAWRKERLADAARFASGPMLRRFTEALLQNPVSEGDRAVLLEQLRLDRMGDQYHEVLLIAPDGRVAISTEESPSVPHPATQRVVAATLAKRSPLLSDFFLEPDGTVHIDAAETVVGANGQPLGALILRSRADESLFPLIQSWPTPSVSAETLLFQRIGNEVIYLNELRHRSKTALVLRLPLSRTELPAAQAVLGKQGIFQGKDYRGVDVLADLRGIPDSPWFMVAKVDAEEIFAEARYRAALISSLVVSLVLLAGAATAYVHRHRQAHLFRELCASERQQQESQRLFRATLYSIGDAVITTDNRGLVREMNPAAEALTGWPESEARGEALEQVFHVIDEDTRATVGNPVEKVLNQGSVVGLANHTMLLARDGVERPITDSAAPIREDDGTLSGVVLVFSDRTKEREAQRALQMSEHRLRAIIETEPECVKLVDRTGKLMEMNPAGLAMLEADSLMDVQGRGLMDFIQPDFHAAFRSLHESVMRGESGTLEFEVTGLKGTQRWLETHAVPLRDGKGLVSMLLGITRDITERKSAEAALLQRGRQLAVLSQASQLVNAVLETPTVMRQLVNTALELTGATDGAAALLRDGRMVFREYHLHGKLVAIELAFERGQGVPGWVLQTRAPYMTNDAEHDPHVLPDIQKALGFTNLADIPVINRQGELLGCFEIHNKPGGFNDNDILMLQGLAASAAVALENAELLAQREKAEAESRAASQKLALHVEGSPLGVIEWGTDFRVARWNPAAERIFGFTAQEALGQHALFIVPDSFRASGTGIMANLVKGVGGQYSTNENLRKDGSIITCEWHNTPLIDAGGRVVGVASQVQDITSRKAAEARIQRLTQLYLALSQCNQAIVRATDEGRLFAEVCRGAVLFGGMKMAWIGLADAATGRVVPVASFGDELGFLEGIEISLDAEDPRGRGPTGTAIREDRPSWCQDFRNDPATVPWHERGARSGWRASAALPLHRNGRVAGGLMLYSGEVNAFDEDARRLLMEMTEDISHAMDTFEAEAQRKRAEAALQESEWRYRTLAEWTPEPFCVHRDGKFIYVNPAAVSMFGAASARELLGQPILDRIHPDFRPIVLDRLKQAPSLGGRVPLIEEKFLKLDGTEIDVEVQATFIDYDGAPAVHVAIRDITQRKQTDEALRASLREKESLLREIHHRVKNNLQVITSLLRLEAGRSQQPGTRSVLQEMQNRIRSMALLHESLYRSENLEQVDLPAYIKQLTTHLFRSMLAKPGSIQLELELAPVSLPLEQAVPCGLLVNELVSNCLKHGFPDGREGKVRIELQALADGQSIRLRVGDTGVGLPADFDEKSASSL
ncbi:MAG: PAS domain S-box protein, partial [Acidobacteriota bacterium]|nr:PAS domain S-box protein [Acidobacteriota bacterium]